MRPSRYDRGPVLFHVSDRTFVWYGRCTFVSICNISLLFLLKMSDLDELESEPGETVDGRIASCQAVLKRPAITDKDKRYVQEMLNKAIAIKKKKNRGGPCPVYSRSTGSPLSQRGLSMSMDPPNNLPLNPPPARIKLQKPPNPPPPHSKKARTDPSPPKIAARGKVTKVKGPPTKRPQIEEKNKLTQWPMTQTRTWTLFLTTGHRRWDRVTRAIHQRPPHPKKGEADQVQPRKQPHPNLEDACLGAAQTLITKRRVGGVLATLKKN